MAKKQEKALEQVTEDEFNKLQAFASDNSILTNQLGNIVITEKRLEERKTSIFKSIERLDLLKAEFEKELLRKYGNKIIDPQTGIISDPNS